MKTKAIIFLLLLLATVNAKASDTITVRFDVENAVLGTVALVYHQSINESTLVDGKATAQLDGMDALYAKVFYGEKNRDIYLQKGDDMTVSFDANDFDNTFSVKGGNEKAADYLGKIQLVNLPDES